ncbi:dihydrolipoyllysine-residue succinyltransferase component of 2-oxoglutarate dehydrogenase complex 1, mitochondrial-like [Lolium perenne]|uniref:dihydrolipoyllysine-residue succinyltransferase component of 2-oxoglutarate dehydrogenase complex 1, mitochondrial-like n=1 Tax=Lolium perenne TaxID=4522 RepID=UPI0021F6226E|nr:dihydrolipoyllysine-residue succinyltransferase component of 2-oxoglutarate dehydrogenase complex 1, mitochondrial-like [Lolium perenne]
MASDGRVERIASTIRVIPDFPKPGPIWSVLTGGGGGLRSMSGVPVAAYMFRELSALIQLDTKASSRVDLRWAQGCLTACTTLGLLRSHTHVRNYSSQLSGLIPAGPQSSKLTRRHYYFPNASPYQPWSRSFASDSGEKFEAVVPFMGESVTDGTLATFLKKPGDRVEADEAIAQIETDKVTIDVSSPEAGVLEKYGTPNWPLCKVCVF